MNDQDIDYMVANEYLGQGHKYDEKIKILIDDALNNNYIHLEKYDIDYCFEGEVLHYFEADTISEIEDYVKGIGSKIKAILFFINSETDLLISEVLEALNMPRPYCTKECLDRKFLPGYSIEGNANKAKYRILFALKRPPKVRKCPFCTESIPQKSKVCKFCGRDI